MEKIEIGVQGMTCGGCVSAVTRVLQGVSGVAAVQVDLARAVAAVEFDPAQQSSAALCQAIEQAGFSASV